MSPILNPLQDNELWATVTAQMSTRISEQVRQRVRDEMAKKKMSQRDMAGLLDWSQSRIAHLLTGRVEMGIDDVQAFGFALGVSLVELVRDRGFEFVAEMTPTELRILERIRALTPDQRSALLLLLGIVQNDKRSALPAKVKRSRGAR